MLALRPLARPLSRAAAPAAAALALLMAAAPARAQEDAQEWLERCREGRGGRAVHCEVRETRLAPTGQLDIDASPNGGISVQGWDRNEVLVQARVQAHDDSEAEARQLASEVRVISEPGSVRSDGPDTRGRRGWSVSYVVHVPRRTGLDLESTNGGLRVRDVAGELELSTTNGGISLAGVAGDVRGETTNGSLDVQLAGDRWSGEGLSLETTNGAVTLTMPRDYGARLEARTTNGGLQTDIPVTLQGRIGRSISAEIGGGGPPIRVRTTNGGIRLRTAGGE